VELDRSAAELAPLLRGGPGFTDAPSSEILGARCRVGRAVGVGDGLFIVLVEPDTEGRLAAFLARFGEGWVARWEVGASSAGRPDARLRPGPLGPERLADDADTRGPFRLLVETATIAP
jgi:hypothetical protein